MDKYKEFLKKKRISTPHVGFDVAIEDINQKCMDYQQAIIRWALRRGRAAIFGDTGNGKTIILAEWAKHVASHTGGKILIATPLAVAMMRHHEVHKRNGVFSEHRKTHHTSNRHALLASRA